jgi:hypothetical protein
MSTHTHIARSLLFRGINKVPTRAVRLPSKTASNFETAVASVVVGQSPTSLSKSWERAVGIINSLDKTKFLKAYKRLKPLLTVIKLMEGACKDFKSLLKYLNHNNIIADSQYNTLVLIFMAIHAFVSSIVFFSKYLSIIELLEYSSGVNKTSPSLSVRSQPPLSVRSRRLYVRNKPSASRTRRSSVNYYSTWKSVSSDSGAKKGGSGSRRASSAVAKNTHQLILDSMWNSVYVLRTICDSFSNIPNQKMIGLLEYYVTEVGAHNIKKTSINLTLDAVARDLQTVISKIKV